MANLVALLTYGPFTELVRTFAGDDVFSRLRITASPGTLGPAVTAWSREAYYWFEVWTDYVVDIEVRAMEDRDLADFIRTTFAVHNEDEDDW